VASLCISEKLPQPYFSVIFVLTPSQSRDYLQVDFAKGAKMRRTYLAAVAALAISVALSASSSWASTCVGNCGTDGADGVVTLSPTGNSSYDYISTSGGVTGAGQIPGVGGTNGSEFTSTPFAATAGEALTFYFNYVTSDGAEFADYGWAALEPSGGGTPIYLFTARTEPTGNTSPGQGLPANSATLVPASSAIIPPGPVWSKLGGSSGSCFSAGCGYTGWIQSVFDVPTGGNYEVVLGVTNFLDQAFDTGLAFDGLAIGGVPIEPPGTPGVPEPATWAMMLLGFGGLGFLGWRRTIKVRATA
jgi:hypothetical protein